MIDTWTRGPNGTRTFPVRIDITIRWNNGKADYTSNRIVNSQAELDRFHTELEKSIKEYIDSRLGTKPTHPQNDITSFSGKIDPYYG